MVEIVRLHTSLPARITVPAFRRYRLLDLARMFAIDGLERRTQIARLRSLARLDGLPLPLNPRVRGDRVIRGADAICAASEWDAAEVDAWRHRPGPTTPVPLAGLPPMPTIMQDNLRDQLRGNAQRLAGGQRLAGSAR